MMDTDAAATSRSQKAESAARTVHATVHFLRVLCRHKMHVVAALVVCGLLGALYCTASTPRYEARASLLVIPTGADLWNTSTAVDGGRRALIPTYERLFSEDVVLDGAVALLRNQPGARVDFRGKTPDQWSKVLRSFLTAKRVRRTNLIEIAYRSRSPRAAEAIVAAIVQSYLDFMEKNHRDVSTEIVRILGRESSEIEQKLQARQQQLLAVKRRVGDLGLDNHADVVHPVVQRVLKLNERLIEVRQQRLDLQANLIAVRDAIRSGSDLRPHLVAMQPTVGREWILGVLGLNPQSTEILGQIEQKLMKDRARLNKLRQHYGPAHPDVVELQEVIDESENYVDQHQQKVQRRLEQISGRKLGPMLISMLEQGLARVQTYEQQLTDEYEVCEAEAVQLNDQMAEATLVKSEVDRLRHLHETLLNRIAGIDINQERADVRVTVVSDPVAGDRPVSPNLMLVALLCLVGGLGIGVGIVYVLDLMDDRFRSPEEMQQQLDASVLAMIRTLPDNGESGLGGLTTFAQPDAPESEAFRTLRTALRFSSRELDSVAITSTEPSDGKTTVLASLGVTFAQADRRTLLIDADLRRPGLSRLLDVRGVSGLSQLLGGDQPVADQAAAMIRRTTRDKLDVLPSGARPSDPAELLGGPRFAELLAWAAATYEQVLVDCPPVMAASDAAIIARQTDGVAVVIRPDKNPRRAVLRAVARLRSMQADVIGVIANRIEVESNVGYYGLADGYGGEYAYGDRPEEREEDAADPRTAGSERPPAVVPVRRRAA